MSQPQTLVLATGNPNKVREIRQILGPLPLDVMSLADLPAIDAPVEDGAHFADNARIKALHYASATGHWSLADDSGLDVDALDGAPGVRSARYAADEWPEKADRQVRDAVNTAHLLRQLGDLPPQNRTARFVCHLALAEPGRVLIETFDTVEGVIANQPRGKNGFGYDPVFYIPQLGRTAAELSADEKNEISHRGKALRHFANLLRSLLASKG